MLNSDLSFSDKKNAAPCDFSERESLRPASAASYLELKVSLCPVASKTRRTQTHRYACIRLVSLEMPGGWRGSLSIHSQTPARLSSPICPLSLYHLPPSQPQHTHTASKQTIHTRHASRTANSHSHMAHQSKYHTKLLCEAPHSKRSPNTSC